MVGVDFQDPAALGVLQTASRHQPTHIAQWNRYGAQKPSSKIVAAIMTVEKPKILNSSERITSID